MGDPEVSGPGPRARDMFRCLARFMGRIWLWLVLGSSSDMR